MLTPIVTWFLRPPSFWRLNIAAWSGFSVVTFLLHYSAQQDFLRALGFALLLFPAEILISGLLRKVYRRSKVGHSFQIETAALLILLSLAAACVEAVLAHGAALVTSHAHPAPLEGGLVRLIFMWLIYMGWSLGYFWLKADYIARSATQRADRAQSEAQRLELQLLRAQLDPHFLFDSLNGVASEIKPRPNAAVEMVQELSEYLRYSLEQRHRAIAPLDVELQAMRAYLRIEQARFGQQLHVAIEASEDARHRLVPSFLLQPLVENAIKHGLKASPPPWDLSIRATTHVDKLIVEVSNNGQLTTESFKLTGVGLEALRRRLKLLYSDRSQFALENHEGRVRAILDLEGDPCSA